MTTTTKLMQDVLKCSRCGSCQYFCPSYSATKMETHVARGRNQLIKKSLKDPSLNETLATRVNQCLLCGNCTANCPSGVLPDENVKKAREACVEQLGIQKMLGTVSENIDTVGNITGDIRENRLLWFENMEPGSVRVGEKAEYIYFTGCVPALYPSSYSIPQEFAKLMNKAGLDWTTLGEKENCCAHPLVLGGLPEKAIKLMERNARDIAATGAKTLVTTCPSCYHSWKKVYPEMVPDMPEINVMHSSQLLAKLVKDGAFKLKETNCVVTYHDSCDLGRRSGIYEEPREVIKAIPGVALKEMKFNRAGAFCCGGGGNLEMNDPGLSGKVAVMKVDHAQNTGAETIITACQQCKRTIAGGVRQKRARMKVMDVTEFLMSAVV